MSARSVSTACVEGSGCLPGHWPFEACVRYAPRSCPCTSSSVRVVQIVGIVEARPQFHTKFGAAGQRTRHEASYTRPKAVTYHQSPPTPRNAPRPDVLDFLIIGAQKAGTTSLHHYLSGHPQLELPLDKEAPFFNQDPASQDLVRFIRENYRSKGECVRGKVTPHYMLGHSGADVSKIARRIADALPDVRLVAMLRDPIERAHSHYRMSVRRGSEHRSFEAAVVEQLTPHGVQSAREAPTETNSYVCAGEYGRILDAYLSVFDRRQLFIIFTEHLEQHPASVLEELLSFLGVDPAYRPANLNKKYFQGGDSERLPRWLSRVLFAGMRTLIPLAGRRAELFRRSLYYWFEHWNTASQRAVIDLSPHTRRALRAHYAQDTERLASILGQLPPWCGAESS